MPEHRATSHLPGIHTAIIGRLHREFVESFENMAQHIDAADRTVATPNDTCYHLQQALEAASSLRVTLQQIAQHCGTMEAAIR